MKALQLSAMRSHTLSLYPFFAGDLSGYPLFAFAPALQWQVGQEPFCSCARRPSVLLFPGSFKKYSSPHTPPPPSWLKKRKKQMKKRVKDQRKEVLRVFAVVIPSTALSLLQFRYSSCVL